MRDDSSDRVAHVGVRCSDRTKTFCYEFIELWGSVIEVGERCCSATEGSDHSG